MNFFEQELRRFTGRTTAFKSCKALYAGRACFIPLSGSRRARLEFVTSGVADQYDALQVTILSTADGKIDCLRFRFSDFFAPRKSRMLRNLPPAHLGGLRQGRVVRRAHRRRSRRHRPGRPRLRHALRLSF